jgi:hypothetical protein
MGDLVAAIAAALQIEIRGVDGRPKGGIIIRNAKPLGRDYKHHGIFSAASRKAGAGRSMKGIRSCRI